MAQGNNGQAVFVAAAGYETLLTALDATGDLIVGVFYHTLFSIGHCLRVIGKTPVPLPGVVTAWIHIPISYEQSRQSIFEALHSCAFTETGQAYLE